MNTALKPRLASERRPAAPAVTAPPPAPTPPTTVDSAPALAPKKPVAAVHGSDTAPVTYFDGAYACGQINGVIQLELARNDLVPDTNGDMHVRRVTVGHLRCSPQAAAGLAELIERALSFNENA